MEKPILMIHEFKEEFLSIPNLDQYILTFDDGLASQFRYIDQINKINTEKYFFVSTGIICTDPKKQSNKTVACATAHKKAAEGNFEDYMTLNQIAKLIRMKQVTVGGHGHSHTRLSTFKTLAEKTEYIKRDTEKMLNNFYMYLSHDPDTFCFPYNEDLDGIYKLIVQKYGFSKFFGRGRIPIETLLPKQN